MKAAFFDVTGTLVHEGVLRKYILFLSHHHVLPQVTLLHLMQTERKHKKHHLSELQTSQQLLHLISKGLKGFSEKTFKKISRDFAKEAEKETYPHTRALLNRLRKKGYRRVAVSGAFKEVVAPLCSRLNIDESFGSRLDVEKGRYTGKVLLDLTQPANKKKIVEKYAKKHRVDLSESFCFGDMILDVEMMGRVGKPIALHAGPALLRACKRRHWPHWTSGKVLEKIEPLL